MKEAAEVNKKRNDMHVEKRTRDKTIRDAMVRGRGGRGARKGKREEGWGVATFIFHFTWHFSSSSSYCHCMCRMC